MNRVAVVTCLLIGAFLVQIGGCSHQLKQGSELLSWTYCGFIALVSNAEAEEIIVPTPEIGAPPAEEEPPVPVRRRCYFVTAKWCPPCLNFHHNVLPSLGLTYGPNWESDIMVIDWDKNQKWLGDMGFELNNVSLPMFVFEKDGASNRRVVGATTKTVEGFLTKEKFLEEWHK